MLQDRIVRSWLPLLLVLIVLPRAARAKDVSGKNAFDYFGGLELTEDVPAPQDHLRHAIGERFTRHADLLAYLRALAAASDRVLLRSYGRTHQDRELVHLVISSPANLARLEEILARNRELADPRTADPARVKETIDSNPTLVWLSYNVHGNEPSSSEAAMQVAYSLAAAGNREVLSILDRCVVVIDPCLNPDGRERYVGFYDNVVGKSPDPLEDAAEHDEPWPGGRTNHYLFDLNRDWLWLVHPESRARVAAYRRFLPHLHVDYHEMGARSPYFFGEGDEPYNKNISSETRAWIALYGKANAEVFDREGLVYSTRERFDYLYPGYGKVLPTYHGAVGLLCEKGGHSRAGLALEITDQYTLTLGERAYHHFLTSMSYLETSARNRKGQIERFHRFFEESLEPAAPGPRVFLLSGENDPRLLVRVFDLCTAHGIEIDVLRDDAVLEGMVSYRTGKRVESLHARRGSFVVRADQPMGRLVRALFEADPGADELETYDISAWSLPVVYGLDAWSSARRVDPDLLTRLTRYAAPEAVATGDGRVALLVDSTQHRFPRALGVIARHRVFARLAGQEFTSSGRRFSRGSLVVHAVRNPDRDLDEVMADLLAQGVDVQRASSGLVESGEVLGVDDNRIFALPKVALLRGEPLSSSSYGGIWHLLDVESPTPYTVVNVEGLSSVLSRFNVLVVPECSGLETALGEGGFDRLKGWVREGGTLIAVGASATWASQALLDLKSPEAEKKTPARDLTWKERQDRSLEERISGALLRAKIDETHPLTAGASAWVGVLKRGDRALPIGEEGAVLARYEAEGRVGGLISGKNLEALAGTPFVTWHRSGRGAVICFSDDPTFRGFHLAAMRLLLNAILLGPTY